MTPLPDYHMHTPRCNHAEGRVADYARAAITAGLSEIGISDHSPMPTPFDDDWRMRHDELDGYVAEVMAAQIEFADTLTIRLGLEVDWRPGCEAFVHELAAAYPWDYLIGSVHYLDSWAFDDPDQRQHWDEVGIEQVYIDYYAQVAASAASGLFDTLGHPDLAKKFGHRPSASEMPRIIEAEEAMLMAVQRAGVALEISAAGLRKPVAEIYPHPRIIERAAARSIPFSYGSDAHQPQHVGHAQPACRNLLLQCGIHQISHFTQRQRTLHPLQK
ncbi:MAG: histidinol-phosphatase HisJ family protein [Mariprofundales bacterium]|nr:histidinol-phosphatase HisJ family protein [Mariprofundales bacterium]